MVRVDGNLDPETGQTVITAVKAVVDHWVRSGSEDGRTPAQRRADALGRSAGSGWTARTVLPSRGNDPTSR